MWYLLSFWKSIRIFVLFFYASEFVIRLVERAIFFSTKYSTKQFFDIETDITSRIKKKKYIYKFQSIEILNLRSNEKLETC